MNVTRQKTLPEKHRQKHGKQPGKEKSARRRCGGGHGFWLGNFHKVAFCSKKRNKHCHLRHARCQGNEVRILKNLAAGWFTR
jgi:hypothetical protein